MTLRGRIFTSITVFILVVLAISLFLLVRSKNTTPAPSEQTPAATLPTPAEQTPGPTITQNSASGAQQIIVNKVVSPADALAVEQAGVTQLARVFIERYQTFSNENQYENIRQIKTIVSSALWKKLSAAMQKPASTDFRGVTTNALGAELSKWGGTTATILVQTRRENTSAAGVKITNQNYLVDLVKVGNAWLVDSFRTT